MQRLLLLLVLFVAGCAPEIGDACDTSTDCSQGGERLCDVAQPGGYCTVFDCEAGKCPEEATCVVFGVSPSTVDACEDPTGTNPSQRSFCMVTCREDSDCRVGEGYVCLPPRNAGGESVDGDRRVCLLKPLATLPPNDGTGDVCLAEPPSDGADGADGAGGAGADD
jgi:hypothetical protein